jgi:hypothetical protein
MPQPTDQDQPSAKQRATAGALPLPEVELVMPKRKTGRQWTYDPDLVNQICEAVSGGKTLRAICRELNFSEGTFRNWVINDLEGLATRYARCRLAQSEAWADELIEIGDDTANDTVVNERGETQNSEWISRSRLRCDNRKWLMARCNPLFADKAMLAVGQAAAGVGVGFLEQATDIEVARRLAAALQRGAEAGDE